MRSALLFPSKKASLGMATYVATCIATCAILTACSPNSSDGTSLESAEQSQAKTFADSSTVKTISIENPHSEAWNDEIVYEIWPRSFYDSDGDGHGDFKGMSLKLDYLQDLGIGAVWLGPVFETPSYHGYDASNLYRFSSIYGSMEDFEYFMTEAHKRGIKVVLDLVLNHISNQHEWFIKSEKKEAGYEDFFVWREDMPENWGRAWSSEVEPQAVWHWSDVRKAYYYGAFGSSMPDTNLTNPAVVKALNEAATFWLEKGVDGFRLDAVRYAVEEGPYPLQADTQATFDYWTQLAQHVKSVKADALMVGEAWVDLDIAAKYGNSGKGLNSVFDFDFGYIVKETLVSDATRTADFGTVSEVAQSEASKQNEEDNRFDKARSALWENLKRRDGASAIPYFSPFLTNHDQDRLAYSLGNNMDKAKIAASLLMTSPGTVYMYYGEEIGLSQPDGQYHQYRRAPMQWNEEKHAGFTNSDSLWLDNPRWFPWIENHQAWWGDYWKDLKGKNLSVSTQEKIPESLLNHYKRLIEVRNTTAALRSPETLNHYPIEGTSAWIIEAIKDGQSTWVIINLDAERSVVVETPSAFLKQYQGESEEKLSKTNKTIGASLQLEASETLIF